MGPTVRSPEMMLETMAGWPAAIVGRFCAIFSQYDQLKLCTIALATAAPVPLTRGLAKMSLFLKRGSVRSIQLWGAVFSLRALVLYISTACVMKVPWNFP